MNRCPISYAPCTGGMYATEGLSKLSPGLTSLDLLPYSAHELRMEAASRAGRMSVQGVQAKLSARLEPAKHRFRIVDQNGRYILKPQSDLYPQLPENEDLSMRLARLVKIDVPLHGMIWGKDRQLTYFIRRFDRVGRSAKVAVEDFAQLSGLTRETKYDFSMEKLAALLDQFCTFPVVEKEKLFRRVVFNFLIGNEDMHLKNYSMITLDGVIQLAPAYDFLNSSIVLKDPEEIALPLHGKKRHLSAKLLIDYWGQERLGLNTAVIEDTLTDFQNTLKAWRQLIDISFLSSDLRVRYHEILARRCQVLRLSV